MIDIHNHLMFKVDDGSRSFIESFKLLQDAAEEGITDIILTPHYIHNGEYRVKKEVLERVLPVFQQQLVKERINIRLYLGNELYIHKDLDILLGEGTCCSLNGSRYVLVEFSFGEYKKDYDEALYNLKIMGYEVIIAHPERYLYVKKDPSFVKRWVDEGYLLQVNQNAFNKKEKHMVYDWIAKGYVYFVASDAHNENRPCTLIGAYQEVTSKFDDKLAKTIFVDNPRRIIKNQNIDCMPNYKKTIFGYKRID